MKLPGNDAKPSSSRRINLGIEKAIKNQDCGGAAGFTGRGRALISIARSPLRVLVKRNLTRPSSSSEITAGVFNDVNIQPTGRVTKFSGRPSVRVQTNSPSFNT